MILPLLIRMKERAAKLRVPSFSLDAWEVIGFVAFIGLAVFLVWSLLAEAAYSYMYYARFLHNGR